MKTAVARKVIPAELHILAYIVFHCFPRLICGSSLYASVSVQSINSSTEELVGMNIVGASNRCFSTISNSLTKKSWRFFFPPKHFFWLLSNCSQSNHLDSFHDNDVRQMCHRPELYGLHCPGQSVFVLFFSRFPGATWLAKCNCSAPIKQRV